MIVSASYKTDIPALYGRWFMNRLADGFCRVVNPWGGQIHEVSLAPEAVDGFVFWTRNAEPFLEPLAELRRRGIPFVVHYTVTGYPRALETSVPESKRAVEIMRHVADTYGPDTVVWRYDPVVTSSLTPPAFHEATFARLAGALEGATDEVVLSFAHVYRKTRRNLDRAARATGFEWEDPAPEAKRALAATLAEVAAGHGMRLGLCTQPELLSGAAEPARCIDAARLSRVAGRPIAAAEKGNRPGCLCHESRDIGAYDTCTHGCVYCYAVSDRDRARARQRHHDPEDPILGGSVVGSSGGRRAAGGK
jgi:hypothetical protein